MLPPEVQPLHTCPMPEVLFTPQGSLWLSLDSPLLRSYRASLQRHDVRVQNVACTEVVREGHSVESLPVFSELGFRWQVVVSKLFIS